MRTPLVPIFCLAAALAACSKAPTPLAPAKSEAVATPAPREVKKIAPCELLTSEEVESIQGEKVTETKSSETKGAFMVSQCYYALTTSSNSVVITLTQRGGVAGAREPREFWEKTFRKREGDEKGREEEEAEKVAPIKVEGAGEEAFWTGNAVGGALYVLSGDAFIRIAIGGAADQTTKIQKSKTLAEMALRRL